MRIDSSAVGMESARSYRASNNTAGRFTITDYRRGLTQGSNTLNAAIGGNAGNTNNKAGWMGGRAVTTMQDWQVRFQSSTSGVSIRSSASQTFADIRQQTVRYIFELLFSHRRNWSNQWTQGRGMGSPRTDWPDDSLNVPENGGVSGNNGVSIEFYYEEGFWKMSSQPITPNMKVLNFFDQGEYFEEAESTAFSTVGKVRTSDGREISFNVNVGMSREFQEYYKEDLKAASFDMCDPLIINLDTDVAQLQDQTFYFDIDGDGALDEVSQLGAGSGYLALDKNGDGVINDGKELFGTASGNGFADLAKYDEDGNGWIDEGDAIWDKLKIWAKDENGKDVLYRLADKGVGAICLQNISTDFTQKGAAGQTLGAVRNTGVFLYENGNVGTVQHVDVAKYDRGA